MIFTRIFFPAISMQILMMIVNNIIIVYLFKGHKKLYKVFIEIYYVLVNFSMKKNEHLVF